MKHKYNRKVDLILSRSISLKYMRHLGRPCTGNLADFWWRKIQWKPLVGITLENRVTDDINWMITLSQLSFLMSKAIFRHCLYYLLITLYLIPLNNPYYFFLFWINFLNLRLSSRKFFDPKQNIPNEFFKFFRRKLWRTLVLKIQVNK